MVTANTSFKLDIIQSLAEKSIIINLNFVKYFILFLFPTKVWLYDRYARILIT